MLWVSWCKNKSFWQRFTCKTKIKKYALKFCCLSIRRGSKMMWLIFLFSFFSFISPTTTTLLRTSSTTSIKINQKPNMFKHVLFCEKLRKKLWKIDLNLVKTNPGKVISKGMIDISGHPNIAAAGGGKTRIYKSAGKELSNRFF